MPSKKSEKSEKTVKPVKAMVPSVNIAEDEDTTYLSDLSRRSRYTVGFLRNMYVLCNDTPEKFAERFDLLPTAVSNFIARGDWDVLRERNKSNTVALLQSHMVSNLVHALQNELKQQEILNKANEQKLAEAQAHFEKHKDYFMRTEDGKFVLDSYGEKTVIASVYGIMNPDKAIKRQTLIQGLTKLLGEIKLESVNLVRETAEPQKQLMSGSDSGKLPVIDLVKFGFRPEDD